MQLRLQLTAVTPHQLHYTYTILSALCLHMRSIYRSLGLLYGSIEPKRFVDNLNQEVSTVLHTSVMRLSILAIRCKIVC